MEAKHAATPTHRSTLDTTPPDLCMELLVAIISVEPTPCPGSEQCDTTLQVSDVCCEYMQERPPEWHLLTRVKTQCPRTPRSKSQGCECKPGAPHSCLISHTSTKPQTSVDSNPLHSQSLLWVQALPQEWTESLGQHGLLPPVSTELSPREHPTPTKIRAVGATRCAQPRS